eukprot:CAMPEP_0202033826 /NCGR_PEP_ID=MMETSP0905-20130828/66245_1 /ASSEMBLY_ACC=CAM_ASM_000554 /TAXON_ID=420261 /ORGANISM="Thalassiosira antarctica, Strain CCMP982" /LENGTH=695 /DNA_ID=CAMNT_0048597739 /DNA_START=73 /DNA_END=2159 /DNA_ORIENTATION=-
MTNDEKTSSADDDSSSFATSTPFTLSTSSNDEATTTMMEPDAIIPAEVVTEPLLMAMTHRHDQDVEASPTDDTINTNNDAIVDDDDEALTATANTMDNTAAMTQDPPAFNAPNAMAQDPPPASTNTHDESPAYDYPTMNPNDMMALDPPASNNPVMNAVIDAAYAAHHEPAHHEPAYNYPTTNYYPTFPANGPSTLARYDSGLFGANTSDDDEEDEEEEELPFAIREEYRGGKERATPVRKKSARPTMSKKSPYKTPVKAGKSTAKPYSTAKKLSPARKSVGKSATKEAKVKARARAREWAKNEFGQKKSSPVPPTPVDSPRIIVIDEEEEEEEERIDGSSGGGSVLLENSDAGSAVGECDGDDDDDLPLRHTNELQHPPITSSLFHENHAASAPSLLMGLPDTYRPFQLKQGGSTAVDYGSISTRSFHGDLSKPSTTYQGNTWASKPSRRLYNSLSHIALSSLPIDALHATSTYCTPQDWASLTSASKVWRHVGREVFEKVWRHAGRCMVEVGDAWARGEHADARELASLYITKGVPIYPTPHGHSYHTIAWRMGLELENMGVENNDNDGEEGDGEEGGVLGNTNAATNAATNGTTDPFYTDRYLENNPTNNNHRDFFSRNNNMTYVEEKALFWKQKKGIEVDAPSMFPPPPPQARGALFPRRFSFSNNMARGPLPSLAHAMGAPQAAGLGGVG